MAVVGDFAAGAADQQESAPVGGAGMAVEPECWWAVVGRLDGA